MVQDTTGDANGNLYLSRKYQASTGNFNAFARKLNSSGSVLWTKTYGTPTYDDARGITTLSGNEIYTIGEMQGSLTLILVVLRTVTPMCASSAAPEARSGRVNRSPSCLGR